MSAESGHAPNRAYIGQDGNLNLNGASILGSSGTALTTPGQLTELTGGGETTLHSHGIQVRTTHITSTQLLALHTTAVELVPAPGSGHYVLLLYVTAKVTPVLTAYTFTPAGSFNFGWGTSPDDTAQMTIDENMMTWTVPRMDGAEGINALNLEVSQGDNLPLTVNCDKALTLGDGSLDVTVVYIVP